MSAGQAQGPSAVAACGRRVRSRVMRACGLALLIGLGGSQTALSQALTGDLFNPVQDGFNGQYDPLRKTPGVAGRGAVADPPAPSRIGKIPSYGTPAAAGAGQSGFDSSGRKKKAPPPPPGAPAKSLVTGPGTFFPPPPPPPPSANAHKAPLPPAMAGTVPGQPTRRKLKVDDDPFGAVGFYVGPFLTKAAVEIYAGHDSNPGRIQNGPASWFYRLAPELVMTSDWSRHSLVIDLRGSFTGYGHEFSPPPCDCVTPVASPIPNVLDRPDFNGKVIGRIDVTSASRIDTEARMQIGTDNPGSPNIQAGLVRYPIFTTLGGTLGGGQKFNRLELSGGAKFDRTTYTESHLTDGTTSGNDDRDFNQYGGFTRASYDLMPGVKPFAQVDLDERVHDINVDRSGYQRDSKGVAVRGGTTFEFSRLVTGEISIGRITRTYQDPRLDPLSGLLTAASLVWTPTALTTVKLTAQSDVGESTLAGVSGALTRDYGTEIEHSFRRWLIGTLKLGYGTTTYQGALDRRDQRVFAEGDIVYKLTRTVQVKASVRREWVRSNITSSNTDATVFMLGMRFQP